MMILGTIGLGMTVLFNEIVVMYFGFLLLFGSGVQLMQAFRARGVERTLFARADCIGLYCGWHYRGH